MARNDGAMEAMGQQLLGFTQATQHQLEALRSAVDERLAQAVGESRTGRAEQRDVEHGRRRRFQEG